MGKGTINSHIADGQYSLTLNLGRDLVTAEINRCNAQAAILATKIAEMPDGIEKDVAELQRTSLLKRVEYLEANTPSDPTVTAWCADLTEDLSGEVGTIEIPGERGSVNIQPGYDSNADYSASRDGELGPVIAQPPAGAYYNLAMLPGWQKWKPTYRYGTITSIDHDANTCNVTLDAATSSQQSLNVNQSQTLTDVTIGYMNCDSAVFEEDDEVVVEFMGQDFGTPRVIGFKDNPRSCGFQIKLTRGDGEELIGGPEQVISVYINVYDSNENLISTNKEYNETTGYWHVTFETPQEIDENGYWLDFTCEDGLPCNYPSKYKTADKHLPDDLVPFGEYEDEIPYWKVEVDEDACGYVGMQSHSSVWGPYQAWVNEDGTNECYKGLKSEYNTIAGIGYGKYQFDSSGSLLPCRVLQQGSTWNKCWTVKSSVPYRLTITTGCSASLSGARVVPTMGLWLETFNLHASTPPTCYVIWTPCPERKRSRLTQACSVDKWADHTHALMVTSEAGSREFMSCIPAGEYVDQYLRKEEVLEFEGSVSGREHPVSIQPTNVTWCHNYEGFVPTVCWIPVSETVGFVVYYAPDSDPDDADDYAWDEEDVTQPIDAKISWDY